jgi:hypothetical protein
VTPPIRGHVAVRRYGRRRSAARPARPGTARWASRIPSRPLLGGVAAGRPAAEAEAVPGRSGRRGRRCHDSSAQRHRRHRCRDYVSVNVIRHYYWNAIITQVPMREAQPVIATGRRVTSTSRQCVCSHEIGQYPPSSTALDLPARGSKAGTTTQATGCRTSQRVEQAI